MTDIKRLPKVRKIVEGLIGLHDDYVTECGVYDGASFWGNDKVEALLSKLSEHTKKPTVTKPKTGKDRLKELRKKFDSRFTYERWIKGKTPYWWYTPETSCPDKVWQWITTNFKPKEIKR